MVQITKSFVEKMLKEPILDFEVSAGAKPGDNVAGTLKAIKVNTAAGKTLNLVFKNVPDSSPEVQGYAIKFSIFLVEITMYEQIGPRLEKFAKSRGATSNLRPPMPKFIAGNLDMGASEGQYLCLEDVRPQGYIMPDKFKGLTLPEVNLVLKQLAKLHATSYCLIKYEGEKIFDENEGMTIYRDNHLSKEDPEMMIAGQTIFLNEVKNAVKVLTAQNQTELAARVQSQIVDLGPEEVYKLFKRTNRLTDVKTFPCIIHGDIWVNNMMIKHDEQGNPIGLMFLDFQQGRKGNIYEELGYLIMTSTTPELRKNHLLQMLNNYYEAFAATLEELNFPLPVGFTRGQLIDTFYDGMKAFYMYMCFAIPMQLADPFDPSSIPKENDEAKKVNCQSQESNGDGPKLTMEEMMIKGFEMRSLMFFGQMMKSPKAMDRLVAITQEMADLKVI